MAAAPGATPSAALSNGSHTLTATATDAAGNTSATSVGAQPDHDSSAAAAPVIGSYSTDTGTAGDRITSDNTPTLSGTAEANSTVKVYDGATLLGTTTANGSGAWSYTSGALSNGAHSLTVTATDTAGNTSVASAALNLTIDTVAAAPVISLYSTDTGTVGDGITRDNTLTLTGTAEANSTVSVYDGATLLGTVTTNGSGAWSYISGALSDGSHSLTAIATDAAGNTSTASAALNVTIDGTTPGAPSILLQSTAGTLTLSGEAEAHSTVKVYDGTTLLGSATADGDGLWSFTSAPLSDSAHSLTATVTDTAGNVSAASSSVLIGSSGNDALTANAGDDWLDGLSGADTMTGGAGSDTYMVDNAGDVVTETGSFVVPSGWALKGTGDFNNDGELDVVVSSSSANQIWLLKNNTVSSVANLPNTGMAGWQNWTLTGVADLNNDGHEDALYTNIIDGRQWGEYLNGTTLLNKGAYYTGASASAVQSLPGNEIDTVVSSVSYALASNVEDLTLAAGAGNINGTGNSQNNVIIGNEGHNLISGKGGVDTLTGNGGADTFAFAIGDSSADPGKHDLITDFTQGVDQIDLTALDADTSTPSRDAFRFLGGAAFDGAAGALHTFYDSARGMTVLEGDVNGDKIADFAIDLSGNHTLGVADFTTDSLLVPINKSGTPGADTLTGGALNDQLYGLGGNDTLTGKAGNDWLDGGIGADTMIGGTGNDTYVVDNAGDVVTRSGCFPLPAGWTLKGTADFNDDGELDVVVSSATANQVWLLKNNTVSSVANLPNASTAGWQNWTLTGISDLNNDGRKDALYTHNTNGKQWGEYLNGTTLLNNGAYYTGKAADGLQPLPGNAGTDTVISSVSHTLANGVENLTLASGAGPIGGTGNSLDNVIVGNEGNNVLSGLAGNDYLDGGAGADTMAGGAGDDTYVVDNAGDVVTEAGGGYAVPAGWTLKGTADFNNDGELDIVVSSATANQILASEGQRGVGGHTPAEYEHVGLAELGADRRRRPQQ